MHAYTADALEGRDADTSIAEGTGVYHASHTILEEGLRKIKESARVCKGGYKFVSPSGAAWNARKHCASSHVRNESSDERTIAFRPPAKTRRGVATLRAGSMRASPFGFLGTKAPVSFLPGTILLASESNAGSVCVCVCVYIYYIY